MNEPVQRQYNQDRATVMAIIKYVLFGLIVIAVGYISLRLLGILVPFILGFILAKASSSIAINSIVLFRRLRKRYRHMPAEEIRAGIVDRQETLAFPEDDQPPSEAQDGDQPGSEVSAPGRHRKRKKLTSTTLLSLFVFTFMLLLFIGMITTIVFVGAAQVKLLVDKLPDILRSIDPSVLLSKITELSNSLGGLLPQSSITILENELLSIQEQILEQVPAIATGILNLILGMVGSVPMILFWMVVVIATGYYFLTDKRIVREFLRRNVPSQAFISNIVYLINHLFSIMFRTIGGFLLLIIISFIMYLIILLIVNIPYAVVLAVVAAVLDILPFVGQTLLFIPLAIYLAFGGNYVGAAIIVVAVIIESIIRKLLEPLILGSALHIHPMATLFSMIVGLSLFGVSGVIVGPLLLVAGREAMHQFEFDQKLRAWFGKFLDKLSPPKTNKTEL